MHEAFNSMPEIDALQAPDRYVLLDANITAGYYAPETLKDRATAAKRVKTLVQAVRTKGCTDIKLLTSRSLLPREARGVPAPRPHSASRQGQRAIPAWSP
ncbi:MAG TPA: hypothetical protein VGI81_07055 [Tepidisphaeraceae bacterium]|jgi:hypothetical protein